MDVREKLVELIHKAKLSMWGKNGLSNEKAQNGYIASYLIANGVTVQEHGYWETVVEVKDNTVCGNGIKIEYKRCSCCKNPAKFLEDDFCGYCGAKLDLPQPPKGG